MNSKGKTVFCHFSFRRPRGKKYGLFAVAFFFEYEGKKPTARMTKKIPLWQDHQFITAIQSYEFALSYIYHWQGVMKMHGIDNVMLVTDNSTLAGWIEDPKKNKAYTEWMNKAVEKYRVGGPKEIVLGVGLARVRNYEKSYKFCKEEYVIDDPVEYSKDSMGDTAINLESDNIAYRTLNVSNLANLTNPVIDTGIKEG